MRIKSTLLVVVLLLSLLPVGASMISTDENHGVPAPVFQSLNETGVDDSHIYENNTAIEIEYEADRYAVDGLVLLGSGSNLTEDLSNTDFVRNFTLVESLRDKSTYVIELNVTSYTYFYAVAYSGDLGNFTKEELDFFDNAPGHELWIEEGNLFPTFDTNAGTFEIREGNVYVPFGTEVELFYEARVDSSTLDATDYLTIAVAENDTALYEEDKSIVWQNMSLEQTVTEGEFVFAQYAINITVNTPILYFSAFNDYGWERSDATTGIVHEITTGFRSNSTYFNRPYNTLDAIEFNITTFNETAGMSVGYQYRVFDNATTDDGSDWTIVDNLANVTGELIDFEIDSVVFENSTLKRGYSVTFDHGLNESMAIEITQFVKYGADSNRTIDNNKFTIGDPTPTLNINSANETYVRSNNRTIFFDYSTPKGEIVDATVTQELPTGLNNTPQSILDDANYNVTFAETGNETIIEGNHTLYFNITNSYNVSVIKILIFQVDQSLPTGNITIASPTTPVSTDGRVTVDLNYEDVGIAGIGFVKLNWGNNITINATGLSQANMLYRTSGEFTITMTVYDKAGNMDVFEVTIQVTLPVRTGQSDNGDSPISILPIVLSIFVLSVINVKRRRD